MNLKKLLLIQAVGTFVTFVLIFLKPDAVPALFGIKVTASQYLLPLLIAANEGAIAYLSFSTRKYDNKDILRIGSSFFAAFHLFTAVACGYAILNGASLKVMGNIIFRVVMVVLFLYYGVYPNRVKAKKKSKGNLRLIVF